MLIIRSLTYNAYYIRGQARYKTCDNLRKRIFLHLGCKYEFKFKKRKKGTAIAML